MAQSYDLPNDSNAEFNPDHLADMNDYTEALFMEFIDYLMRNKLLDMQIKNELVSLSESGQRRIFGYLRDIAANGKLSLEESMALLNGLPEIMKRCGANQIRDAIKVQVCACVKGIIARVRPRNSMVEAIKPEESYAQAGLDAE